MREGLFSDSADGSLAQQPWQPESGDDAEFKRERLERVDPSIANVTNIMGIVNAAELLAHEIEDAPLEWPYPPPLPEAAAVYHHLAPILMRLDIILPMLGAGLLVKAAESLSDPQIRAVEIQATFNAGDMPQVDSALGSLDYWFTKLKEMGVDPVCAEKMGAQWSREFSFVVESALDALSRGVIPDFATAAFLRLIESSGVVVNLKRAQDQLAAELSYFRVGD